MALRFASAATVGSLVAVSISARMDQTSKARTHGRTRVARDRSKDFLASFVEAMEFPKRSSHSVPDTFSGSIIAAGRLRFQCESGPKTGAGGSGATGIQGRHIARRYFRANGA